MSICADYSGVVFDQNQVTGELNPGTEQFYQTFRLPEDYLRGSKPEQQRFPSISGFQLLAEVEEDTEETVTLEYTLEQHNFGSVAWEVLAKGTAVGAQADGKVWLDVILGKEIPVTPDLVSNVAELRIGFKVVPVEGKQGIAKVFFAEPNPLPGFVEALQSDGSTPLRGKGAPPVSFSFRLLGLVADAGIDFLGDPYRGLAVHSSADVPTAAHPETGFWLSGPQPSRFAVVSHYSDVRQFPETATFGEINSVVDPSFEYDVVGEAPYAWSVIPPFYVPEDKVEQYVVIGKGEYRQSFNAQLWFNTYKTGAKLQVIEAEGAPDGTKVLEVETEGKRFADHEGAFIGGIPVSALKPQTFSVWLRAPKEKEFKLSITLGDPTVGFAEEVVTVKGEWQRFSVTLTPKEAGTTHAAIFVPFTQPREARKFYVDAALIEAGTVAGPYFDGDHPSAKWENAKGRSGSIELLEPTVEEDAVTIDAIILNPMTPGVAFNVYYTNDLTGSDTGEELTEEQWEQKLWVHVPKTFVTSVKTTYVLPEPISAKFVKIEFSHLQPRPYEPGDYQSPTQYKLYPDWVATPFLAEIATPEFTAKRVGVVFDALELAYQPVLADLLQGPSNPEHPTPTPTIAAPAANQADPKTLRLIETTINTYTKPPAARQNATTLLGIRANINSEQQTSYPVEGEPRFRGTPTQAVSGLDRQAIVTEESIPAMFFWVTCRHEYKELRALFEHDVAYFAGLKELFFVRNQYSTTSDTAHYVEAGTDDTNTERSDFNVETYPVEEPNGSVLGEESVWFTY